MSILKFPCVPNSHPFLLIPVLRKTERIYMKKGSKKEGRKEGGKEGSREGRRKAEKDFSASLETCTILLPRKRESGF